MTEEEKEIIEKSLRIEEEFLGYINTCNMLGLVVDPGEKNKRILFKKNDKYDKKRIKYIAKILEKSIK